MTTAHYTDEHVRLYHGDCIEVMRQLPDASVDAVVTDPPYGLGFMGKEWDAFGGTMMSDETRRAQLDSGEGWTKKPYSASGKAAAPAPGEMERFQSWCQEWAAEALRVLKPGGHLLAFGGTRTWHRLACAIEDAGFEVRDSIAWMYGSGFPKSLDVSKAMDKAAGAERDRVPYIGGIASGSGNYGGGGEVHVGSKVGDEPQTDLARQWQGWGTALKPAFEPVVVARKPLVGTVAANVERYGTGALNINGARIGMSDADRERVDGRTWVGRNQYKDGKEVYGDYATDGTDQPMATHPAGRWPANVILDESQAEALDRQSGVTTSPTQVTRGLNLNPSSYGKRTEREIADCYGDTGGASRFFYTAKADSSERPRVDGVAHPTVKPLDLMRYLVRLVTPPGGVVLEPFAGSGTTLEACIVEGFRCIGIEREADYIPLIMQRITKPLEPVMF